MNRQTWTFFSSWSWVVLLQSNFIVSFLIYLLPCRVVKICFKRWFASLSDLFGFELAESIECCRCRHEAAVQRYLCCRKCLTPEDSQLEFACARFQCRSFAVQETYPLSRFKNIDQFLTGYPCFLVGGDFFKNFSSILTPHNSENFPDQ